MFNQQKLKSLDLTLYQCNEANRVEEKKFCQDKKICCRQEHKNQKKQNVNLDVGRTLVTIVNSFISKKKENSVVICYNSNKKSYIF